MKLLDFIQNKMSLRANYQPVVIMALLKREPLTRQQIAERLAKANPTVKAELDDTKRIKYFERVPVFDVLTKHKIIQEKADGFYLVCDFDDSEKAGIIKVLIIKASKWSIEA